MKIAIFASAFHPHTGGVEELVRQLAHAYRRAGHEAIVITNRWPRDLLAREEFEGISVYRAALRSPEAGFKSKVSFAVSSASIQREVNRILQEAQSEMVHVQCVSPGAFYAARACRELNLPLVVTTQGERTMDASQVFQRIPWFEDLMRSCLSDAKHITACSRDTLKDVEKFFGEPFGDRAEVVYNGIRVADFDGAAAYSHSRHSHSRHSHSRHSHSRSYILGIGRMVPQKGFDILLRAFARADCPSHDLILAGDGVELENLKTLSRELNLDDRVQFFGRADRIQAVALFKGCSFFVIPSRREPQGIVSLEAMCAQKAVIAARVGGVPEIVLDGETGLLFPGEDVDALARHLTTLANDETLRETLAKAGRARAEEFDWDALAAQYLSIYGRVLADFRAAKS